MWPLTFVLLLAMAPPPQNAPAPDGAYIGKIPQTLSARPIGPRSRTASPKDLDRNVCFAIRSYHFRRQNGYAPVPAGVTTCTPAIQFSQKQVLSTPKVMLAPMDLRESEGGPEK